MLTLAASTGNVVAMALGGIVAVLAVCAVFYAIGRGEDRDRALGAPTEGPPDPPAEDSAPQPADPPRPRSPSGAPKRRRP